MRLVKEGKMPGLAAAAFALAAAGSLPRLLNWSMDATHSAVMLLLAVLLWRAGKAVLEENNRRLRRFSLAFGLALSLYGMYEDNKRYTRSSPYGRVKNSQSRSDDSRKVG